MAPSLVSTSISSAFLTPKSAANDDVQNQIFRQFHLQKVRKIDIGARGL